MNCFSLFKQGYIPEQSETPAGIARIYAVSLHNPNIKRGIFPTPLDCVLNALIFASNDSANAFVSRFPIDEIVQYGFIIVQYGFIVQHSFIVLHGICDGPATSVPKIFHSAVHSGRLILVNELIKKQKTSSFRSLPEDSDFLSFPRFSAAFSSLLRITFVSPPFHLRSISVLKLNKYLLNIREETKINAS